MKIFLTFIIIIGKTKKKGLILNFGAVEAISCVLSMKHGIIPPTINHFNDDDGIDSKLNFTFSSPQKRSVNIAMSNTFGFGGHNACVIFKKFD